jgi:hypothetical protein
MNLRHIPASIALLFCSCTAFLAAAEAETPPTFKARDVVPLSLLKSNVHTVGETVELDRFLCKYQVQSPFGVYQITSTEMLKIRVHELQVLNRAKDISGTREFFGSLKDSVVQVPVAVVDTVVHPIASVKKIGQGVKSKFSAVGRFFGSGRKKSKYEDNALKDASLGKHKRQLAAELTVDVYSTNPNIQKLLNSVARARSMGKAPVRLAGFVAPPGVGIALTMLSLRRDVNRDLWMKTPSELHALNNKILKDLDIRDDVREAFLSNKAYSPRHKTTIVANLDAMDIDGLEHFLITTLDDTTEEEALFAERQSDMLLYYHKRVEKLKYVGRVGRRLPVGVTKKKNMVVVGPVDYVYVDKLSAETMGTIAKIRDENEIQKVTIAITGHASRRLKDEAAKAGFTIREFFMAGATQTGR